MEFLRSSKLIVAGLVALLAAGIYALSGPKNDDASPTEASAVSTTALSTSNGLSILPAEARSFHELRTDLVGTQAAANVASVGSGPNLTWSVNGSDVHTGNVLSPHHFRPGDTVEVRAEQTVNGKLERVGNASVVIPNTLPNITVANLQRDPRDATRVEALVGASDPDGDPIEYHYEWRVDGDRLRGAEGKYASLNGLDKGAKITCAVTVRDPFGQTEPYEARPFTIENRAPTLELDAQATMRKLPDGTRQIRYGVRVSDPDGDMVDVTFPGSPANLVWDASAAQVTWTVGPEATESRVQVRVDDGKGASVERDLVVEL